MPQSLLAFLAMMMATLAALNQYQSQLTTYESMVRGEYEVIANAVVIEQMEIVDLSIPWANLESVDGDTTTAEWAIGSENVSFQLAFAVQYVDEDGTPSGTPTTTKEVAISASNSKFSTDLVNHTRMFTQ
jgi:hypothetical protein